LGAALELLEDPDEFTEAGVRIEEELFVNLDVGCYREKVRLLEAIAWKAGCPCRSNAR
jgi:hypothetical protein